MMTKDTNANAEPLLNEFNGRLSQTLTVLSEWAALHYTGHFIDAHPEMKWRIDAANSRTIAVLHKWGVARPLTVLGSGACASQAPTATEGKEE